ncbi:hypothetical protein GBA52_004129 [Prunus armeniaca]|nr:hypothetical protein GBA52_004129 [Prunus armeniaca]
MAEEHVVGETLADEPPIKGDDAKEGAADKTEANDVEPVAKADEKVTKADEHVAAADEQVAVSDEQVVNETGAKEKCG